MRTNKKITMTINKPYDYKPIPEIELERITKHVTNEVFEMANKFDGPCKMLILITAKGNA